MFEITFGDSSSASLKLAQSFGKGKYSGEAISFAFFGDEKPSRKEIERLEKQANKKAEKEWEAAEPLGGEPEKVFGLALGLSFGDISEDFPGEKRKAALEILYGNFPNGSGFAEENVKKANENLEKLIKGIKCGEKLRIWFGSYPDELCGFYQLVYILKKSGCPFENVSYIRLPDYRVSDGVVKTVLSAGSLAPGDFSAFLHLEKKLSFEEISFISGSWERLKNENLALRVFVGGSLVSVEEDFYDRFILRELKKEKGEFSEGKFIAGIFSLYNFGIGDAFISKRLDFFVSSGIISVVKPSSFPDMPYRILRV